MMEMIAAKLFSALVAGAMVLAAPTPVDKGLLPEVSRWEADIQAFEEVDRQNPPAKGGVLFIGSSSIKGWRTLKEDFPEVNSINRGFGGSQIEDSVRYARRIALPYKPRIIVLYAGENDLSGGKTPQQVFEDYRAFVRLIHAHQPQTRIIFISLKPSGRLWHIEDKIVEANRLIQQHTETSRRLDFVDIHDKMLGQDGKPHPELYQPDELHMTPAGFQIWVEALRPYLR